MDVSQHQPITILGAGAWGTALALYLARRGQIVNIWSVEPSEINAMVQDKANQRYLPGYPLPELIHPTIELGKAVNGIKDIIMVVPSVGFRQTLVSLKPFISADVRIICATKGLDAETGQLLNEVVEDVLGKEQRYAVLSGPSFAREVAAGLPAAVIIASKDKNLQTHLMQRFNSSLFQTHPSEDIIGVEIGGVVKNVIAIATGISDGMQLGANARSAIITNGLAEMTRLGLALGGQAETFVGLAGLGDLILTCSDDQSRNRRYGLAIGKNADVKNAEKEIGQVVEGKRNAELVALLAQRHDVEMPVCGSVWDVLQGNVTAKDVIEKMMQG